MGDNNNNNKNNPNITFNQRYINEMERLGVLVNPNAPPPPASANSNSGSGVARRANNNNLECGTIDKNAAEIWRNEVAAVLHNNNNHTLQQSNHQNQQQFNNSNSRRRRRRDNEKQRRDYYYNDNYAPMNNLKIQRNDTNMSGLTMGSNNNARRHEDMLMIARGGSRMGEQRPLVIHGRKYHHGDDHDYNYNDEL